MINYKFKIKNYRLKEIFLKFIFFVFISFLVFDDTFLFAKVYEFEFLNTPSGVRAMGLGENFVSMENSVEGLFVNPAIAGTMPFGETVFAHHLYYNNSYVTQLALNIPMKKFGFGITGKYFSTPDIPAIINYQELGQNYSLKSFFCGAQVGVHVFRWLGFGIGAKYVNENMLSLNKNIILYDTGFVLNTKNDVLSFSGSLENYNADDKYIIQSFYNIGLSVKLNLPDQASNINFLLGAKIDTKTMETKYSVGLEHWGSDVLGLRLGYVYDIGRNNLDVFGPITFFRAGLSLRIKSFTIDYGFLPSQHLTDTHNIGLSYRYKDKKKVDTIIKQAFLEVEPYYFSPNSDGYKDNIFFIHNATSTKGFVEMTYEIRNNSGDIVTTILFSSDTKKVDSLYVFNGTDKQTGQVLPDGVYNVNLKLVDITNKQQIIYETAKKEFVLDTTPPKIKIIISTPAITPNNDSIEDELNAEIKIDDILSPIESISLKIFTLSDKQIKSYLLNVSTQNTKSIQTGIVWDCRDELYGKVVHEGEYKILVTVKDLAGNKSFAEERFRVVIVEKNSVEEKLVYIKGAKVGFDERGLIITYPTDDLFIKGTSDINPQMHDSLSSLADVIKSKYSKNKILIEGHTDSVGEDNVNIQKSSSYAWSVYSYLIKNFGFEAKNLEVKGYGKRKPIATNKTKIGRAQNRRIEIIVILKN